MTALRLLGFCFRFKDLRFTHPIFCRDCFPFEVVGTACYFVTERVRKNLMKDTDQWLPDFDDPDDLTPEERLARIVHLLALGAIRLAEEEKSGEPAPVQSKIPKKVLKLNIDTPERKGYARTF